MGSRIEQRYLLHPTVIGIHMYPPASGAVVDPQGVWIASDGLRLRGFFYQTDGAGPHTTLLLLHGWPGSPPDAVGLGERLVRQGINVLVVSPRGMHESEGTNTFAGTLRDIGSALQWLRSTAVCEQHLVDVSDIVIGGHSFGGGMTMAYAAIDPGIRRIISVAGTDHGEIIRQLQGSDSMAEGFREMLRGTRAPSGPVTFDLESSMNELFDGLETYGLRENAARLADRAILLIGGWEDVNTTVEGFMLPLYRSLKRAGAGGVTFLVYHDDHSFAAVRDRMAMDILSWIRRE